jgi:hypothetical protein
MSLCLYEFMVEKTFYPFCLGIHVCRVHVKCMYLSMHDFILHRTCMIVSNLIRPRMTTQQTSLTMAKLTLMMAMITMSRRFRRICVPLEYIMM